MAILPEKKGSVVGTIGQIFRSLEHNRVFEFLGYDFRDFRYVFVGVTDWSSDIPFHTVRRVTVLAWLTMVRELSPRECGRIAA